MDYEQVASGKTNMQRSTMIGQLCSSNRWEDFSLLIEIEIDVMGNERRNVIILEITAAQAAALIASGVMRLPNS